MSNGSLKHSLRRLAKSRHILGWSSSHSPRRLQQWFKWLAPGLLVKRWLLMSVAGILLTSLGLAVWTGMTPIFYLLQLLKDILGLITTVLPNFISGPLAIIMGLMLIFWGQTRTLNSITQVLMPEGDDHLVDRLLAHRRLQRGPKIVTVGGGTGLSTLLRGLKPYSANITAIVTVADDGGSSGRLRREIGVLPPGDIRNCIAALADEEQLLTELFQYRFKAGDGLSGHSFGNLFLTAMSDITGDLERAIAASSKVLAIRGQVLPATLSDVHLWAKLEDGRRIYGESSITEAKGKIVKIGCIPPDPPALPKAIQAIVESDLIIIGPGSLYTSVIPNLLVPEIAQAIASANVPRIYVCNAMTQPGETDGYTVGDHILAIDNACGCRLFDAVLVQGKVPLAQSLIKYAQEGSYPVILDRDVVKQLGRRIVLTNVIEVDEKTGYVRHNSERLAQVLLRWYSHA
ncbi:gluconeogenesis factor YvcK family protein [Limnoraphis robusta Tam1]|uniref:Putative gluconeogenesis factor n=1 Tax=Limnoraphis robusta CCNP1315 TaxID=3110306 RepID=A0ABU5TS78_9CYAN|nr:gluconeogenesis factor YvcK family protein [Limnoraphis robusta]MEA5498522.1 gluconeogenesis factor YvcK family protein [Limnoraphis robusta BA-68 BA1]MEA5517491.1 gluconeogenesis factor YvcK family protein [Limnoraphis robusta CCNP1315]MEA5542463.1 gluconeogenesis factor YvcK family protein [Limnoraphis robusta Tam1]MEA5548937.1 gluconeogenesis factor YvcK family protein [Limnoraphis robusta CCNP1324]